MRKQNSRFTISKFSYVFNLFLYVNLVPPLKCDLPQMTLFALQTSPKGAFLQYITHVQLEGEVQTSLIPHVPSILFYSLPLSSQISYTPILFLPFHIK